MIEHLEVVSRMSKDVRAAAITLSDQQARYLVDSMQENRIRAAAQQRALTDSQEPNTVVASEPVGMREPLCRSEPPTSREPERQSEA